MGCSAESWVIPQKEKCDFGNYTPVKPFGTKCGFCEFNHADLINPRYGILLLMVYIFNDADRNCLKEQEVGRAYLKL